MRLKIEINTREHFSVLGQQRRPFRVVSPWFTGSADVVTYQPNELCELWDNPQLYAQASAQACQAAERLYGEAPQRQRFLDYFASLKPGGRVLEQ